MDLWQKARGFADEAAKRSQEISREAARRSQELTKGAARFSQDFVTDAAKRSREIAAEASKKADQLRTEAAKRADQIKTFAGEIEIPNSIAQIGGQGAALLVGEGGASPTPVQEGAEDLETFAVTEELREFVKGITLSTFKDFPLEDEPHISDAPPVSNVRQDLNEWQARHATLVLSTVKEISKFRYELCPRHMKERKFWRIYFILVNNYVERCEKKYMEEKLKLEREKQNEKARENVAAAVTSPVEVKESKSQSKTSTSASADHDLDVFLLGDLGSSDEGSDIADDEFDDDFDKIDNKEALDSDGKDKEKAAGLSGE